MSPLSAYERLVYWFNQIFNGYFFLLLGSKGCLKLFTKSKVIKSMKEMQWSEDLHNSTYFRCNALQIFLLVLSFY